MGESSPRTEHPKIGNKHSTQTSQKAQWEFREERAVKSRKSAPISSKSSFSPAPLALSRPTSQPHLHLHCVTLESWLRSPGQVQGTHSVTHSGVQGSADPHRRNRVGRHRKGTAALSQPNEPVCMRGPREKGLAWGCLLVAHSGV